MYISDMSYDEVLDERKDIERRLVHKVITKKSLYMNWKRDIITDI